MGTDSTGPHATEYVYMSSPGGMLYGALETAVCYLSSGQQVLTGQMHDVENGIAFKAAFRNSELLAGENGLEGRKCFTGWGGGGRGVRV